MPQLLPDQVAICCQPENNDAKLERLRDLLEMINDPTFEYTEELVPRLMDVVTANVLRSLPDPPPSFEPDEDRPRLIPEWDHLEVVYELLYEILDASIPPRVIKQYITSTFCTQLLAILQSEDPRERVKVATTMHKIYAKFKSLRQHIRRSFIHILMQYVEYAPTGYPFGISELLEVLSSIIKGFATPLQSEHIELLTKTLLPLLKLSLRHYDQPLLLCMTSFVEKDPKLTSVMLDYLVKCWPKQSTAKQILYLNAIEEILETAPVESLPNETKTKLTHVVAKCLESDHFQVAERTLFLWNSSQLINYSIFNPSHTRVVLPILFPSLMVAFKEHWNITVRMLAHSVLEMYTKHDNMTYQICLSQYKKAHATVFYGSQTGTAQRFATSLAQQLGLDSAAPLESFKANAAPPQFLFIVCASYGSGGPPDNAQRFYDLLDRAKKTWPAHKGVQFAVFGCGNSLYMETFNGMAKFVDSKLAQLGARRFLDIVLGDASSDNLNTQYKEWETTILQRLGRLEAPALPQKSPIQQVATVDEAIFQLESIRSLSKTAVHIELTLPPSIASYNSAGTIVLYPRNAREVIQALARRLNYDLSQTAEPPHVTIDEALTNSVDLGVISQVLLAGLAPFATDASQASALHHLGAVQLRQ
ncbi:unnamed protein product [Aphanomyces euteiches]